MEINGHEVKKSKVSIAKHLSSEEFVVNYNGGYVHQGEEEYWGLLDIALDNERKKLERRLIKKWK
jgi:hypothetical protein